MASSSWDFFVAIARRSDRRLARGLPTTAPSSSCSRGSGIRRPPPFSVLTRRPLKPGCPISSKHTATLKPLPIRVAPRFRWRLSGRRLRVWWLPVRPTMKKYPSLSNGRGGSSRRSRMCRASPIACSQTGGWSEESRWQSLAKHSGWRPETPSALQARTWRGSVSWPIRLQRPMSVAGRFLASIHGCCGYAELQCLPPPQPSWPSSAGLTRPGSFAKRRATRFRWRLPRSSRPKHGGHLRAIGPVGCRRSYPTSRLSAFRRGRLTQHSRRTEALPWPHGSWGSSPCRSAWWHASPKPCIRLRTGSFWALVLGGCSCFVLALLTALGSTVRGEKQKRIVLKGLAPALIGAGICAALFPHAIERARNEQPPHHRAYDPPTE